MSDAAEQECDARQVDVCVRPLTLTGRLDVAIAMLFGWTVIVDCVVSDDRLTARGLYYADGPREGIDPMREAFAALAFAAARVAFAVAVGALVLLTVARIAGFDFAWFGGAP